MTDVVTLRNKLVRRNKNRRKGQVYSYDDTSKHEYSNVQTAIANSNGAYKRIKSRASGEYLARKRWKNASLSAGFEESVGYDKQEGALTPSSELLAQGWKRELIERAWHFTQKTVRERAEIKGTRFKLETLLDRGFKRDGDQLVKTTTTETVTETTKEFEVTRRYHPQGVKNILTRLANEYGMDNVRTRNTSNAQFVYVRGVKGVGEKFAVIKYKTHRKHGESQDNPRGKNF
jgi:hypothetical protein